MSNVGSITLTIYSQTDVGRVRQGNEDNFIIVDLETRESWTPAEEGRTLHQEVMFGSDRAGAIVAVADGMGGALAGEIASSMAVTLIRDYMFDFTSKEPYRDLPFSERFRAAIEETNLLIHRRSTAHEEYTGMGATFTGAAFNERCLYLAQIGDSRGYLIRDDVITRLTKDQSLVSSLIESGHLTEMEAETHAYRNVILQALGATTRVKVDLRKLDLRSGDIILLCSDGLSGKVRPTEILESVRQNESLTKACQALIDLANENGGDDNITVALMAVNLGGEKDPSDGDRVPRTEIIARDPRIPRQETDDTDEYTAEEPDLESESEVPTSEPPPEYLAPRPRQAQIDAQSTAEGILPAHPRRSIKTRSFVVEIVLLVSALLMLAGVVLFHLAQRQ